jgi:glycerate kinase
MNIIIAIDSFKGCLSSALANQSAADGVLSVSADAKVVQMPVSDGGEGWLSAYHAAIGGELITLSVRDPMMRWIEAQYLIKDQTAVVEIAQASGLPLLTPEERNPMVATSYGTGQLIVDAVRRGCKEVIVGLGGSATSDCGKGMLRAIIDAFAQQGTWDDITELQDVRFIIATDVRGNADVVTQSSSGTLVKLNADEAMAERIAELIEHPPAPADRENIACYDSRAIVKTLFDLYGI